MHYHFINQITNPEQIIADKVNYFADLFDYYLTNIGRPSFPTLENHRSLLEKICFQLNNYSPHSPRYINTYFRNSYLSLKDPIINEFYKNDWQVINSLKVKGVQNERNKITFEIRKLIKKLYKTLFFNSLTKIIECIVSYDRLENSNIKTKLEYHTPIIISEFIFAGFPIKDLEKLFDKILSTKVEIQNNKIKTDIPLPSSLAKYRYKADVPPEVFYNKINRYLKKRTLQQQFKGIYHFYQNSLKEKTFIFYLNNTRALQPIDLWIGKVRFSNQIKSENIKKRGTRKEYRDFFKGKDKIYVQTTVIENNNLIGKENAVREINNAINYFNACLKKRAYLFLDDYIIKDLDQNFRHTSMLIPLHREDLEKLSDDNVYEVLKNHKNDLVKKYLELDKIYMYANVSDYKENKITNFWRYLESFFESENYKSEKIIDTVASILSKRGPLVFFIDYYNLVFQIFNSAYFKYPKTKEGLNPFLNISEIELLALLNNTEFNKIDLNKLNSIVNHPFVNKKINWFLKTSKEEQEKLAFDFYKTLLFETFEQRNFIEHNGIFLGKSVDKILLSLPRIIRDFRALVIKELSQKHHNSFAKVLICLDQNIIALNQNYKN